MVSFFIAFFRRQVGNEGNTRTDPNQTENHRWPGFSGMVTAGWQAERGQAREESFCAFAASAERPFLRQRSLAESWSARQSAAVPQLPLFARAAPAPQLTPLELRREEIRFRQLSAFTPPFHARQIIFRYQTTELPSFSPGWAQE
jgi:hypothetical protein